MTSHPIDGETLLAVSGARADTYLMSHPATTAPAETTVSNTEPSDGRLAHLAAVGGALAYSAMTLIAIIFMADAGATAIATVLWAVCMAVAAVTYRGGSVLQARSRTEHS